MRLDTTEPGTSEGEGQGLLSAFAVVMSKVFIPSLQSLTNGWGLLNSSPQGAQIKNDFISTLDSFVNVLAGQELL